MEDSGRKSDLPLLPTPPWRREPPTPLTASVRAPLNVRHLRKQLALLSPRILNKLRLRIEHHRRTRRQFVRPPRRDPRVRRIATTSERNESFTHLIRRLLRIRIRSGA